MPIEKITAAQFRDQLRTGISSRTSTHDVGFGPIRDIVIDPVATVLETQNDRIRSVSLLISLQDPDNLSETDLDGIVFNELIRRSDGSRAVSTVTFSVAVVDPTGPDLVVQRGFPIATTPDASTGETVTFVTSEARTLPAAQRQAFFNITTQRYELTVPIIATVTGTTGRVGAGRIRRPLRPLVGFDEASNTAAADGGLGRETNAQLIERYLLSIRGTSLSTPAGVQKYARDNFPDVVDVDVVFGADVQLTRQSTDAGAVDVYIVGDQLVARTENLEYLGINQLLPVASPPLRLVSSVISGGTTFVEGTDFEVVRDTSGNRGSTRASEGIRFLSTVTSPPALGTVVTVAYTSNNLVRNLQSDFEQDEQLVLGRDLLVKEGIEVAIILEARLRVASGFSTVTVPSAVTTAIDTFINNLRLGANVELSDIQGEVRRVSGVDNFLIDRLVRDPALSGAADVVISSTEYPRIATADLIITLI